MDAVQQIRYSAGGTLTFSPPQSGRPASGPTYTLFKPDGTTIGSAGRSANLDDANTTFAATASEGDTSITLVDASRIIIGRSYLLTAAADREYEWARAISANTSTGVVELALPLRQDYASGDTLEGTLLSMAVSSSDAADLLEGYECQVSYTVDGTSYVASVFFDVVRQPWPRPIMRPDEFVKHAGSMANDALERASAPGLQFVDEIEVASENVRLELIEGGRRPDLFRSFEAFRRVVALRVILEWAYEGVNIPASYADTPEIWEERQEARYRRAFEVALVATKSYDANDSGTVSSSERSAVLSSTEIII